MISRIYGCDEGGFGVNISGIEKSWVRKFQFIIAFAVFLIGISIIFLTLLCGLKVEVILSGIRGIWGDRKVTLLSSRICLVERQVTRLIVRVRVLVVLISICRMDVVLISIPIVFAISNTLSHRWMALLSIRVQSTCILLVYYCNCKEDINYSSLTDNLLAIIQIWLLL